MKYWNIEPDILHGQQAFISAESVPCNEARDSPPTVRWRQEQKERKIEVHQVWWSNVLCGSLLEASSLQGLAADFVVKVKTMSSPLLRNLCAPSKLCFVTKMETFFRIIYVWLWFNALIILISSFDISPPHPNTTTRSYCNGLLCIFGYTTPVHPPALTSSHQVWIW